jgi:glutathione-regulated potassium-efflux system ancillary protein KefG
MKSEDYEKNGLIYGYFLEYIENYDLNTDEILQFHYLNEWFATIQT